MGQGMLFDCGHLGEGACGKTGVMQAGMEEAVVTEAVRALLGEADGTFAATDGSKFPLRGKEGKGADESRRSTLARDKAAFLQPADEVGAVGGIALPGAGALGEARGVDSRLPSQPVDFKPGVVGDHDAVRRQEVACGRGLEKGVSCKIRCGFFGFWKAGQEIAQSTHMPSARSQDLGEFVDLMAIAGGKNEGLHGKMVVNRRDQSFENRDFLLEIPDCEDAYDKIA